MIDQTENYALITGASKGIGKAMAMVLAKKGYHLLLVARSKDALQEFSSELKIKYGVKVDFLNIDLSNPQAPQNVYDWVVEKNYQVAILINNAGYGLWGRFSDLSLASQLDMCQLNMDALVKLCHLFIPHLVKQKQAYILNVASTAAYQALPTLAIYAATKAFVLSFTRALRYEYKSSPLSISCLSPGPVDTGFADRAGMQALAKMAEKFNMQPTVVAETAIRGLFAKKSEIIPGFSNAISVFATRIFSKSFIEKVAAGIYKT